MRFNMLRIARQILLVKSRVATNHRVMWRMANCLRCVGAGSRRTVLGYFWCTGTLVSHQWTGWLVLIRNSLSLLVLCGPIAFFLIQTWVASKSNKVLHGIWEFAYKFFNLCSFIFGVVFIQELWRIVAIIFFGRNCIKRLTLTVKV